MGMLNDTLLDATGVTVGAAGSAMDVRSRQDFVFDLDATENIAGTLDGLIEDSFDGGSSWRTLVAFAQLSANGGEALAPSRPAGPHVRGRVSASGSWDVVIRMNSNPLR